MASHSSHGSGIRWIITFLLFLWVLWFFINGRYSSPCCMSNAVTPESAPVAEVVAPPPPVAEATPPVVDATPVPVPETPLVDCGSVIKGQVAFESGSAQISADGNTTLDAMLDCMSDGNYQVGGHTDSTGDPVYNIWLSEQRAIAAKDYLISKGVDAGRLSAQGYGDTQPIADNATPEGRAQNRRIELVKQ